MTARNRSSRTPARDRDAPETMVVTFTIPVRTVSESNRRGHWSKHDRRRKDQKESAYLHTTAAMVRMRGVRRPLLPLHIALTRIAPRRLDPDNNVGSMKAVIDGIAYALNVDDGDERIEWSWGQAKGKPGEYGVLVRIELVRVAA